MNVISVLGAGRVVEVVALVGRADEEDADRSPSRFVRYRTSQ
jgi:hypothetical protein